MTIASIKLGGMLEELEVLRIVSERLEAAQLPFMLTGSFAMAYYGKPRMTRDLDIVVSLGEDDVRGIVAALSPDFYIDEDSVRSAVASQQLFNLMHLATSIKVDLIVRKGSEYWVAPMLDSAVADNERGVRSSARAKRIVRRHQRHVTHQRASAWQNVLDGVSVLAALDRPGYVTSSELEK